MSQLSFSNFKDYEAKLRQYLIATNCVDEYQKCKLDGIKIMVDNLSSLETYAYFNQLGFLMWMIPTTFEMLLNDVFFMNKINLGEIKEKLLDNPPALTITGFAGLTPLGGPRGSSTKTVSLYNCIKFIGQFTNSQLVYDKCLDILESLPTKLEGPILNPPAVMYLMNYNKNVDTSKNKYKQKLDRINKLHDFYYSVYRPDPSHEQEYNTYKKDIQCAYLQLAKNIGTIGYLCLLNQLIRSHWNIIENTSQITFLSKINLGDSYEIIERSLIDISNQVIIDKTDEPKSESIQNEKIMKKIKEQLRFIDYNDYQEISSIFSDAFIYVTDDKYNEELYKRNMLIQIYECNLVDINSSLSHNLMREAVHNGNIWIVKFLIEKGVSTQNLPKYGSHDHCLESKQLNEIVYEDIEDYHGYGETYILKKKKDREAMKYFLIKTDII